MRWSTGATVGTGALVAALVAGAMVLPAAADPQLPVPYGFLTPALLGSVTPAAGDPPGANDWSCEPGAEHPDPVVLVHGLAATRTNNWRTIAPLLANAGYCVFALTYGAPAALQGQVGGLAPMEDSAEELDVFVDRVLEATGAPRVDLVGHSEGTLMPQYWLQFLGGADRTDDYVAITPLYDGTLAVPPVGELADVLTEGLGVRGPLESAVTPLCGSCPQFLTGSDHLERMQEAGTLVEGVTYTTVLTRYDELVVPYTSGLLEGATNIVVQDGCEIDLSDHLSIIATERTGQIVLNALAPAAAVPPPCRPALPALGSEAGLLGL